VALEDLIRRHKKTPSLVEAIERGLRREAREERPMRSSDWLRVSSVGSLCSREEVLRSKFEVVKREGISPDLGLVFEVGHALHWVMQNRVMTAADRIVGTWRCTWCGETYGSMEDLQPRPDECLRCGAIPGEVPRLQNKPNYDIRANAFLYVEQWIGDHDVRIGGHPDGFYVDGDPHNFAKSDVVILEFKSASARTFFKYKEVPDFVHVIQVQCYMWLTGYSRAKILYIDKGQFGMAGLAEHDIEYDKSIVDRILGEIEQLRAGLRTLEAPPRVACSKLDCERARMCNVSKQCFGE